MPSTNNLSLDAVKVLGDEGHPILEIDDFILDSNSDSDCTRGSFLALKGISGAGKSTFLNVISGITQPAQGRVLWGNIDIVPMTQEKKAKFRRDNMGLIFQDFPLFEELSLYENITISAQYQHDKKQIISVNAKRMMQHFAFKDLTRDCKNYSGGQKQRIAFMRALVANPKVIIADEPTAALDRENAKKMVDFLIEEKADKTMVVASHDDYLLSQADRVLTIDRGRIIADDAMR